MEFQDFVITALEHVLLWDISEDAYGDAIAHEAHLMAGAGAGAASDD